MCIICREHANSEPFLGASLNISYCGDIQTLPECPNLTRLDCHNCPKLQTLPDIPLLKILYCSYCPNLQNIPDLPLLTTLYCDNCPKLQKIPDLPLLIFLDCKNCPLIQTLPDLPLLTKLYCSRCPWLNHFQNPEYSKNIDRLTKIQRWNKTKKLRKFLRLVNSKEFCEYFYSPDQLGGKWAKRQLYKQISQ